MLYHKLLTLSPISEDDPHSSIKRLVVTAARFHVPLPLPSAALSDQQCGNCGRIRDFTQYCFFAVPASGLFPDEVSHAVALHRHTHIHVFVAHHLSSCGDGSRADILINKSSGLHVHHAGKPSSTNPDKDDDYSDADFEEKRKRAEAGEVADTGTVPGESGLPSSNKPLEPVPSLEESEPEVQQGLLDPSSADPGDGSSPDRSTSGKQGSSGDSDQGKQVVYGSGNFRRAARYFKPKFLVKASPRNVKPDKVRKAAWHREPAPDFCHEAILVHEECDAHLAALKSGRQTGTKENERWSFNLEDGYCYQYHDPCPLFKRNSFTSLSQCLATCWRHATPA